MLRYPDLRQCMVLRRLLPAVLCLCLLGLCELAWSARINMGNNLSQVDYSYYGASSLWANVLRNFSAFNGCYGATSTPDGWPKSNACTQATFIYTTGLWPSGASGHPWTMTYQGDAGGYATIYWCSGNGAGWTAGTKTYSNGVWTIPMTFTDPGINDALSMYVRYAGSFPQDGNGNATDPVHNVQLTCNEWYPGGVVPKNADGSLNLPLLSPPFTQRMSPFSTLRFMVNDGIANYGSIVCTDSYYGNPGTTNDLPYDTGQPHDASYTFMNWWNSAPDVGVTIYVPNTGPSSGWGGISGYTEAGMGSRCLAGTASSPACLSYALGGQYRAFTAWIGKDYTGKDDAGTLLFEVWADGVKLYPIAGVDPTAPMTAGQTAWHIFVNLSETNPLLNGTAAQELTLKVYDPNGPTANDWGDWGYPEIWKMPVWETRSSPAVFYSSQNNDTMPYETQVQICNALHEDAWINIPVTATNTFITKLTDSLLYGEDATGTPYTSTQPNPAYPPLDAARKVYIEYGNEVWSTSGSFAGGNNGDFLQYWEASPTGVGENYDATTYPQHQYAERVKQLSDLLKPLFTAAGRGSQLQIVLAGQATMANKTQEALNYLTNTYGAPHTYVDQLATAAYFQITAPSNWSTPPTVEDLLNGWTNGSGSYSIDGTVGVANAVNTMAAWSAMANTYILGLTNYEGGDACWGGVWSSWCPQLPNENLYWEGIHSTRFGFLYDEYLQGLQSYLGNGVFCQYTALESDGETGPDPTQYNMYWGALGQCNQIGSVKYDALSRNSKSAGDCDSNGSVTLSDFTTLQTNFGLGQSGSPSTHWWLSTDSPAWWVQGDFNNDQIVDMADFWLLYQNLSTTDKQNAGVQSFITAHPNPVILPQLWGTWPGSPVAPISLTGAGNIGGVNTWRNHAKSIAVPVDPNCPGAVNAGHSYIFALVGANPRHGTVTFNYPYLTYTPTNNATYTGVDDFWIKVTDTTSGLISNKVWIPVMINSTPDTSLVADYHFDENTGITSSDASGNGNLCKLWYTNSSGTDNSGYAWSAATPLTAWTTGQSGSALNLSSSGFTYAAAPDSLPVPGYASLSCNPNDAAQTLNTFVTNDHTFSVWVKPTDVPQSAGPCINGVYSDGLSAILTRHSWNMVEGLFWAKDDATHGHFVFSHPISNGGCITVTSGSYPINAWYQLIATVSKASGDIKLYVNGALDGNTNGGANMGMDGQPTSGFFVGAAMPGFDENGAPYNNQNYYTDGYYEGDINHYWGLDLRYPFRGAIDEVRLYSRALSASDVPLLYQGVVGMMPNVSIATPANNASFYAPASVLLTANASVLDDDINEVDYYNGATLIGRAYCAPFTFNWTNVAVGAYTLTAKAISNSNVTATLAAVNITVYNPNPTVQAFPPTIIRDPYFNLNIGSGQWNQYGYAGTDWQGIPCTPGNVELSTLAGRDPLNQSDYSLLVQTPTASAISQSITIPAYTWYQGTLSFAAYVRGSDGNGTGTVQVQWDGVNVGNLMNVGYNNGAWQWYTTSLPIDCKNLTGSAVPHSLTLSITAIAGYYLNLVDVAFSSTPVVATPALSPAGGSYSTAQSVTLSDATTGAAIYYTTDGSTPTTGSTPYTTAIPVNANTTINTLAAATGYSNSAVGSAMYNILVAAPTFNVNAGSYTDTQTVTLSCATSGATMRYTLDGTTPSETNGVAYSTPVKIDKTMTLQAIAYKTGMTDSAVSSAAYTITDITGSLVCRWKLDSNATDTAPYGTANNGTLGNSPTYNTSDKKVGTASLGFIDTSKQYVSVASQTDLNPTTSLTLCAWVKATDWNSNRRIVQKGADGAQYQLYKNGTALTFAVKVGSAVKSATTTTLPSTGVWHHIAGTYDGTNVKLYVDGVLISTTAATGAIATTTTALTIGAMSTTDATTGDYFKGGIDDVRIYSGRALTANELLTVMSVTN